jgi:hypothetical protein
MTWKQYALKIIEIYEQTEEEFGTDDTDYQLSPMMLECWKQAVTEKAKETYEAFENGLRDHPQFTEEEYMDTFTKATENLVGLHLENMVERELLSMSVNKDGDILYTTTEKGIEEMDRLKKKLEEDDEE